MKNKLLIIISIIIVLLALVFMFFIYPKIIYNRDISILKNKVSMVNEYLINNTGDKKVIKEELKKESVSNERIEVEREINNYLNSIIDSVSEFQEIKFDKTNYLYQDEKLKDNLDDDIKLLKEEKEKLSTLKEAVNELKEIDTKNIKNEDNIKIVNDLFKEAFNIWDLYKISILVLVLSAVFVSPK